MLHILLHGLHNLSLFSVFCSFVILTRAGIYSVVEQSLKMLTGVREEGMAFCHFVVFATYVVYANALS
jgi:hypothetical protein